MQLFITEFWQTAVLIEKFFFGIGLLFTFILVIQSVLTIVGGGFDSVESVGDSDVLNTDMGIDFQFLSLKNICAFFSVFGWVGLICFNSDINVYLSTLIATLSGVVIMLIMATIMYYMGKLAENGILDMNNAKGKIATVYLTIPAKRSGLGKVQVKVQGYQTLDAFTDEDQDIATGSMVTIVDVINDEILLVSSIQ